MEDQSREGGNSAVQGPKPATGALRRAKSPLSRNSVPTQGNLSSRATAVPIIMEDQSREGGNSAVQGPKPATGAHRRARWNLNRNSDPTQGSLSSRPTAFPTIIGDKSKEGGDSAVQGPKPATGALRRAKSPLNRNSVPTQGNHSSRATAVPIIIGDKSKEGGDNAVQGPKPATGALRRAKSPLNRNSVPTQGNLSSRATAVPTIMEEGTMEEAENAQQGPKPSTGAIRKRNSILNKIPAMPQQEENPIRIPTRRLPGAPLVFNIPKQQLPVPQFPTEKPDSTPPPKPCNLNLACSLDYLEPPTHPDTQNLPSTPTAPPNSQHMPQSNSPPRVPPNLPSAVDLSTQSTPNLCSVDLLLAIQLQMQEDIESKADEEKLKFPFPASYPAASTSHVDCTGEIPLPKVDIATLKPISFKDIRQKIETYLESKQLEIESDESGDSDESNESDEYSF